MGLYIEACEGLSKEAWVEKYGTPVDALTWPGHGEDYYPVSIIDNGGFKACAVYWLESEVRRIQRSYEGGDQRPIQFFHVKKDALKKALGTGTWDAMQQDIAEGAQ